DEAQEDVLLSPPQVAEITYAQLNNAKIIVDMGRQLGVPEYGQIVALAVAIQESTLTADARNDQSSATGLFQQLDAWAPEAARLDPVKASKMFYTGGQVVDGIDGDGKGEGLLDIEGWEKMSVSADGQAV